MEESSLKFLSFLAHLTPTNFFSQFMISCEEKYSINKLELLGVVWSVEHFKNYLYGTQFKHITQLLSVLNIKYRSLDDLTMGCKTLLSQEKKGQQTCVEEKVELRQQKMVNAR